MSRTIEFTDQDYARIQRAADADGMPLDAWVVANLPLNGASSEPAAPRSANGKPARTMADRFAGRLGLIGSATGEPSSDNVAESFAEYLEAKQRAGRL